MSIHNTPTPETATPAAWNGWRALRRQRVDDLHHAPACPANHYHRKRLVTGACTCGAGGGR